VQDVNNVIMERDSDHFCERLEKKGRDGNTYLLREGFRDRLIKYALSIGRSLPDAVETAKSAKEVFETLMTGCFECGPVTIDVEQRLRDRVRQKEPVAVEPAEFVEDPYKVLLHLGQIGIPHAASTNAGQHINVDQQNAQDPSEPRMNVARSKLTAYSENHHPTPINKVARVVTSTSKNEKKVVPKVVLEEDLDDEDDIFDYDEKQEREIFDDDDDVFDDEDDIFDYDEY
jgi:hypothetical protein